MASGNRRQRKQKKRQERLRQEKHRRRTQPTQSTEREAEDSLAPGPELEMPTRRSGTPGMEHDLRRLTKELDKRDFKSQEDLDAFLDGLTGRRLDEALGPDDDPADRAHELAQQALETDSPQEADELARRALELDPLCIDAMTVQAHLGSSSRDGLIASLRKVVQCAREALGEPFFEEHRGHFWGMVEARPLMRAKVDLAQQLAAVRRDEEAIAEYEEMLELNPGDNQGIRFPLLGLFLADDRLDDARRLAAAYQDDISAVMAWGAVLERHLAGDEAGAGRALEQARTLNPHVEPYLSGVRPHPGVPPRHYSLGDPSEAAYCAFELGPAWVRHRNTVDWLRARANS